MTAMGCMKSGFPFPTVIILIAGGLTSINLIVRRQCVLKSLDKFLWGMYRSFGDWKEHKSGLCITQLALGALKCLAGWSCSRMCLLFSLCSVITPIFSFQKTFSHEVMQQWPYIFKTAMFHRPLNVSKILLCYFSFFVDIDFFIAVCSSSIAVFAWPVSCTYLNQSSWSSQGVWMLCCLRCVSLCSICQD